MALTNVLLRHMKKMHEYTSSIYSVLVSITFFGPSMIISDQEPVVPRSFELNDFLVLVMVSVAGCLSMICKAKAMQLEMASRLSILMYFSIIFTLVFDIMLIGTVFNF